MTRFPRSDRPRFAISRREIGGAAAGVVVWFSMRPAFAATRANSAELPPDLAKNPRLDSWLRINPNGTVEVSSGKVELGQGNLTALAQIAAEELDVAFSRIRMLPADTSHSPNEGFTAGSTSMDHGGPALRAASAEARAILLKLAARKLGEAPTALSVKDGVISGKTGRLTYWVLASEVSLATNATAGAPVKPPSEYTIVGKFYPRIDIPAKVTGGAIYVQDMRLPGMLFGRAVRPPSYHAELKSFDDTAIKKMPGIVAVVRNGRFLGVIARREEQAIAARAAIQRAAVWDLPADMPDEDDISALLRSMPNARVATINSEAPASGAIAPARTLSATYSKPYLAHASMGPSCAVAMVRDGVITVWSHTQGVYPLRVDIAKATGLALEKVRVIHAQGAGCYGHNAADDAAFDAVLLTQAVGGVPVKVQWMRDDEMAWEPYGSAMTMTARAGLSEDGAIVDWQYDLWSHTFNMRPGMPGGVNLLAAWYLAKPFKHAPPKEIPLPSGGGDRNAIPYYAFPSQRIVDHFLPEMPLRVSAQRSLGAFGNVFAIESFMDELANAVGADPVEFRLRHLTDGRAKAVVRAVAERAKWQPKAKGDGVHGRGVAFVRYETIKTYVALIADVAVDRLTGKIHVERATAAVDAGLIVTPNGLANQIEGGIIQATSWTLKEAVSFDSRRVTSRDWASYPILTFPEVPEIDVMFLDHPDLPALGAGEAAQPTVPGAIANAVFNATGKRLRDLPFTPERVRAALA